MAESITAAIIASLIAFTIPLGFSQVIGTSSCTCSTHCRASCSTSVHSGTYSRFIYLEVLESGLVNDIELQSRFCPTSTSGKTSILYHDHSMTCQ